MKKLLVLLGLGGLAYYLKDRLGGEPDEFVFTEVPPADPAASDSATTDPATSETSPEPPPTTPPPTV